MSVGGTPISGSRKMVKKTRPSVSATGASCPRTPESTLLSRCGSRHLAPDRRSPRRSRDRRPPLSRRCLRGTTHPSGAPLLSTGGLPCRRRLLCMLPSGSITVRRPSCARRRQVSRAIDGICCDPFRSRAPLRRRVALLRRTDSIDQSRVRRGCPQDPFTVMTVLEGGHEPTGPFDK